MSHSEVRVSLSLLVLRIYLGPQGVRGLLQRQRAAASAELRTTGSCSHSARGRFLGKQGVVGPPPISPSSGQLSEQSVISLQKENGSSGR